MTEDACVLLVDDDLGLRDQIGDDLSDNGLKVLTASDAGEMDAVLAAHESSLIVLDLNLPAEGGLSICHRLAPRRSPAVSSAAPVRPRARNAFPPPSGFPPPNRQ